MIKHQLILLFLITPVFHIAGSGTPPIALDYQQSLYETMKLCDAGLPKDVFQYALKGKTKLETDGKLRNSDILTVVDFSQSSKQKRFYVIDLKHKTLLINTFVSHGRNTGDEYARNFSNNTGSFQSSLGFYVTKQQIKGSHVGLSLILDGMEKGFNDNAMKREIIIHGADYATENYIKKTGHLGRSYGCPSLPPDQVKPVVELIKDGSCLFIYCGDNFYIKHSKLLN
jgi:hypothetical protein